MAETRVHYKNDQPRQITLVYTPMVVAMIHSLYVKLGKTQWSIVILMQSQLQRLYDSHSVKLGRKKGSDG